MKKPIKSEDKKLTRRSVAPPPKERFEILLEQIRDEVRVVGEGHQALSRKIDDVQQSTDEQLAEIRIMVAGVARDLKEHRADTEAHALAS